MYNSCVQLARSREFPSFLVNVQKHRGKKKKSQIKLKIFENLKPVSQNKIYFVYKVIYFLKVPEFPYLFLEFKVRRQTSNFRIF